MHIESLYKCPKFFNLFPEVYAMEKIHGTSAWIHLNGNELNFHSGGEQHNNFVALFDENFLKSTMMAILQANNWTQIKIHGEAYGYNQQAMSETYGNKRKFIVFDVLYTTSASDSQFLDVPDAELVAKRLDLEFVHYTAGPNTPEWIEDEANKESVQAVRNGMGSGKPREGVVVRPVHEAMIGFNRAIFKHKNAAFWEIASPRPLGSRVKVMTDVEEIANEWVTLQRFNHVEDRVLQTKDEKKLVLKDIGPFINLMVEDVQREAGDEIIWTNDVAKQIRKKTGMMFKEHLNKNLNLVDKVLKLVI
jgi:RNA ligase